MEDSEAGPSLQPFECLVCNRRFTRHENLKRHATLHRAPKDNAVIQCAYCTSTFSRRDLRRRHVRRKHPQEKGSDDELDLPAHKGANEVARRSISAGDEGGPGDPVPGGPPLIPRPGAIVPATEGVDLDQILGSSLSNSLPSTLGLSPTSPLRFDFSVDNAVPWSPINIDDLMRDLAQGSAGTSTSNQPRLPVLAPQSLSPPAPFHNSATGRPARAAPSAELTDPDMVTMATDLFFNNTGHYFSFLHRPTLDVNAIIPPLLFGIMAIGLQFASNPQHRQLASECYHQGKIILSDEAAWKEDLASSARTLEMIQALVLLSNHSIMYMGGEETQHGFRLHSKCVELARKGGLMEPYPTEAATTASLQDLWRNAVRVECHKRTQFAVYLHDAIWYCVLSRPRSLSHLEIKHDLPQDGDLWTCATAEEWAHRTLIARQGVTPPTRYIDAVRNSMSMADATRNLVGHPLSVLLVMMFHFTSIREVSGWATMSGRMSFERFEALHSSLKNMEVCAKVSNDSTPSIAPACEATWHICMIELSLWSQPHTGGLVEGSLDAALAAATRLIAAHPVPIAPEIAEELETHISWMINYLCKTTDTTYEPPWMTIYLFKAALIALQIVGMGMYTSVNHIGISSTAQMLQWMRKVFIRRDKWAIGRLAVRSLDELETAVA